MIQDPFMERYSILLVIGAILSVIVFSSSHDAYAITTQVTVANLTPHTLTLTSDVSGDQSSLSHGCWNGGTKPAAVINPGTLDVFKAVSCGLATGVEGQVNFRIDNDPNTWIGFYFDNPFIGGNTNSVVGSPHIPFGYQIVGGSGTDAVVAYLLQ